MSGLRVEGLMGLRGREVQGFRGLGVANWENCFYKTILKWPYYYIKVVSDAHLHGRFMSYRAQGLRGSGVQKRGYPRLPPSEKKFFTL